jgi:hypothetical protein
MGRNVGIHSYISFSINPVKADNKNQKPSPPERVRHSLKPFIIPPPALPGSGSAGRGLNGPPLSPGTPGSPLLSIIILNSEAESIRFGEITQNFTLDIFLKILILCPIMDRLLTLVKKQVKRSRPSLSGRRVAGV